ncbi:MAG TPA: glycosyltransferase family 39 protein [Acidimicrobiales bacterium]
MHRRSHSPPRWWLWLGLWTLVGLTIRLITVYRDPNKVAGGDAYFYHYGANLLVSGHGFINPYLYIPHNAHHAVQSASFPPLFLFLVAIPSALGLKTFLAERVWCCVLGAAAIVVCGYTGREIGGRRVGLIAAFLVAVYPNIWMTDELALSETIAPLLVAGVLWFTYRFWKRPTLPRAIWLGASLGVAMLGRDELTLLVVFVMVPLVLLAKALTWRRRAVTLAVGLVTVALVVGPWVGYNLSRFDQPVYISSGLGVTLASADCAATYSGPYEGYWSMPCALHYAAEPSVDTHADESVEGAQLQHLALDYVRAHENRLVPVTLAKLGRAFGFFHPMQQIHLDSYVETRPYRWAVTGLVAYYVLLALSIGGTVLLRRRRIPSFPLWAVGLDVVCSVALTFGQTRYRTTFEVSLVLLAAVQLEWFWSRLRRGSDSDEVAGQGPAADPAPPDPVAAPSPGVPDVAAATT